MGSELYSQPSGPMSRFVIVRRVDAAAATDEWSGDESRESQT